MLVNQINNSYHPNIYKYNLNNKKIKNDNFSNLLSGAVSKDSICINVSSKVDVLGNTDNLSSTGKNRELREEEIKYLSEKYDVENMSFEEEEKLLSELANIGAISKEDYDYCLICHMDNIPEGLITKVSSDDLNTLNNLGNNILKRLGLEAEMYQKKYQYHLESGKIFTYFKDKSESMSNVSDILKQLARK